MLEFLRYIQTLPGYTEIRGIRNGQVEQHWLEDREEAVSLAMSMSNALIDAYYGVLPRVVARGDSEAVVSQSDTLWADLDAKSTTKPLILTRLIGYDIPPAVIVDSGHGYHAYWKLDVPIPVQRASVIMRGLAKQLDGDHVYDPPRILRVPGTTNWKDPDHPAPVRVLRFDTTRDMRPADFEVPERIGWREVNPDPIRTRSNTLYIPPTDRDELPPWLTDLIQNGVPQGQRSEAIFKVMIHLVRRGWSDQEIQEVMETQAIGEKYREMRTGGQRWLDRSLSKART